jgi:hypothetical protein
MTDKTPQSILYIPSTITLTGDGGMLLAIGVIIALTLVLITFAGNPVSAQIMITDISWLEDITDSENEGTENEGTENEGTENEGTENEGTESSESLTLEGLSPQGESDLAVACSMLPERC